MDNTKLSIKDITPYFELKGTFGYEQKKNRVSKIPIITFTTRFTDITDRVARTLNQYTISYSYIKRNGFNQIRISYPKNCLAFTNLLLEHMTIRTEIVKEMNTYCNKK